MTAIERNIVIRESLRIAAPPERVWRVFTAIERWREWNTAVRSARFRTGEPWQAGATIEFTVKPSWKQLRIRAEITDVQPHKSVTWAGSGAGIAGVHTFAFQPDGDGTLATTVEVFTGPGLGLMGLVMPQHKLRALFATWLAALKAEAERR
jgi:uncharacterized protein YndB with AHSA1/START domain